MFDRKLGSGRVSPVTPWRHHKPQSGKCGGSFPSTPLVARSVPRASGRFAKQCGFGVGSPAVNRRENFYRRGEGFDRSISQGQAAERIVVNGAQTILIGSIRAYRFVISPVLAALSTPFGFGCRFQPTCSEYALDAVRLHGAFKGTALSVRRICRCNPGGGSGHGALPPV